MATYASIFEPGVTDMLVARINQLTPATQADWGKMNVGQMLAHCNVAYDMETGELPVNNNFITRWMLKTFVKKNVVNEVPYPKNGRTAPAFVISDERDFDAERQKLIDHLRRVSAQGAAYYEGKENVSFGPMTAKEWSNMYHKHLDHHLTQFGV